MHEHIIARSSVAWQKCEWNSPYTIHMFIAAAIMHCKFFVQFPSSGDRSNIDATRSDDRRRSLLYLFIYLYTYCRLNITKCNNKIYKISESVRWSRDIGILRRKKNWCDLWKNQRVREIFWSINAVRKWKIDSFD